MTTIYHPDIPEQACVTTLCYTQGWHTQVYIREEVVVSRVPSSVIMVCSNQLVEIMELGSAALEPRNYNNWLFLKLITME